MVERTSRYVVLAKLNAPTADAATPAITRELSRMAASLLKTMTHDQGSEMARHTEITAHTGMKIYFADPHSPWQRGSNENPNGLLRQYLPKGTDLSRVSAEATGRNCRHAEHSTTPDPGLVVSGRSTG